MLLIKKNSQPNDKRLRKKTDDCWRKVVDKKPPDSEEVLRKKLIPYDWGLKKIRKSKDRSFDLRLAGSHVESCAVTCNAAEDIECGSYSNSFKNIIKIKRSSIFLACLLMLLVVCPYFCLVDSVGLTIGLAIGGALSIVGKVAAG